MQFDNLKQKLSRWKHKTATEFPGRADLVDMIPDPKGIGIEKLGLGGLVNTDTCAATQKERRLIVETVGGRCHEQDCWNHLRNVWINGM